MKRCPSCQFNRLEAVAMARRPCVQCLQQVCDECRRVFPADETWAACRACLHAIDIKLGVLLAEGVPLD